jgi:hypothetical protein
MTLWLCSSCIFYFLLCLCVAHWPTRLQSTCHVCAEEHTFEGVRDYLRQFSSEVFPTYIKEKLKFEFKVGLNWACTSLASTHTCTSESRRCMASSPSKHRFNTRAQERTPETRANTETYTLLPSPPHSSPLRAPPPPHAPHPAGLPPCA